MIIVILIVLAIVVITLLVFNSRRNSEVKSDNALDRRVSWWMVTRNPGYYGHLLKLKRTSPGKYKGSAYFTNSESIYPFRRRGSFDPLILHFTLRGKTLMCDDDEVPKDYGVDYNTKINNWVYNQEEGTLTRRIHLVNIVWKEISPPPAIEADYLDYSDPVVIFRYIISTIKEQNGSADVYIPGTGYRGQFSNAALETRASQLINSGIVNSSMTHQELVYAISNCWDLLISQHYVFSYYGYLAEYARPTGQRIVYSEPVNEWMQLATEIKAERATLVHYSALVNRNSRNSQSYTQAVGTQMGMYCCLTEDESTEVNIVADNYLQNPMRLRWEKVNNIYKFFPEPFNNSTSGNHVGWPYDWYDWTISDTGSVRYVYPNSRNQASSFFFGVIPGGGFKDFGVTGTPFGQHSNIHGDVGYINVASQLYCAMTGVDCVDYFSLMDNGRMLLCAFDYFKELGINKLILDYSCNCGGIMGAYGADIIAATMGSKRIAYQDVGTVPQRGSSIHGPLLDTQVVTIDPLEFTSNPLKDARIAVITSRYTVCSAEAVVTTLMGNNDDGDIGGNVKVVRVGQTTTGDCSNVVTYAPPIPFDEKRNSLKAFDPELEALPLFKIELPETRILTPKGQDFTGTGIPPNIPYMDYFAGWSENYLDTLCPVGDADLYIPNMTLRDLVSPDTWIEKSTKPVDQWKYGALDVALTHTDVFIE